MIVHIMDQPEVEKGAGPIGVVVVPTRELAEQIHKETRKFSKPYQLRVAAAFGGLSKFEQFKDLKNGSEVCSRPEAAFGSLHGPVTTQIGYAQAYYMFHNKLSLSTTATAATICPEAK